MHLHNWLRQCPEIILDMMCFNPMKEQRVNLLLSWHQYIYTTSFTRSRTFQFLENKMDLHPPVFMNIFNVSIKKKKWVEMLEKKVIHHKKVFKLDKVVKVTFLILIMKQYKYHIFRTFSTLFLFISCLTCSVLIHYLIAPSFFKDTWLFISMHPPVDIA